MKRAYDVKLLVKSYRVGDPVYCLDTATLKGKSSKLKSPWKGPGIIVKKISEAIFCVKVGNKYFVVNHDRIKLCQDRILPLWIKRLKIDSTLLEAAIPKKALVESETIYCLCRRPDSV